MEKQVKESPVRDYTHWAKRFDTVKHITKSSVYGFNSHGTFCGSSAACLGNNYAMSDMEVCPECIKLKPRLLKDIAKEIYQDWGRVHPYASPYLGAMSTLDYIHENYHLDSADSVVRYFLSNAGTWRGKVARRVKLELKAMLK